MIDSIPSSWSAIRKQLAAPIFRGGYAASRISCILNGRTNKFGWLQTRPTKTFLSFKHGLTSNRKERSKRDAATAPSKRKPQPTAASLAPEPRMTRITPERWQPSLLGRRMSWG